MIEHIVKDLEITQGYLFEIGQDVCSAYLQMAIDLLKNEISD